MTLEELIDSPEKFESLTDAQLLEYFKPALQVTRPELARASRESRQSSGSRSSVKQPELPKLNDKQQKALAALAAQGIDVSFAQRRYKK